MTNSNTKCNVEHAIMLHKNELRYLSANYFKKGNLTSPRQTDRDLADLCNK